MPPAFLGLHQLQARSLSDNVAQALPHLAARYSISSSDNAAPLSDAHVPVHHAASPHLQARQANGPFLPYTYDYSGPMPGQLAGIVLGVVGGITIIILLFWAVFAQRQTVIIEHDAPTEYSYSRRTRSTRRRRRHTSRHRSEHRSEMSERPPSPPRRRSERIIVEETRRTVSRPPPPPPEEPEPEDPIPMPASPVHERRVEGDDVVEVIEEESDLSSQPPPRRPHRSGYRTVDPNAYGGGNFASRSVYQESDRRRSSRR